MFYKKSKKIFQESKDLFPGGVNSPVRSFNSLNLTPPIIDKGKNQYIYDVDGNRYIDYCLSWGPLIAGHANDKIINAVKNQIDKGTSFGANSSVELDLAKKVQQFYPSMKMMRFVNSGTEATMSAVRLARGFTNKSKIIKFDGCYHGHGDSFLVQAGSGLATSGISNSLGVPEELAELTISLPYNDISRVKKTFEEFGDDIAAIIVEPVAGNMGVVPGTKKFIQYLRDVTIEYNSILIFDEVMNGMRIAYGGAHEYFGVEADLVTLGKVVGGGMPLAIYGGKKDIMEYVAPLGGVYQAGTLSGNPIATVAGKTTLDQINREKFTESCEKVKFLCREIKELGNRMNINVQTPHVGTMFSVYFTDREVLNYEDARKSKHNYFVKYYQSMLEQGIYFSPSSYESNFISLKHTDHDLQKTLTAVENTFKLMSEDM